MSEDAEPIETLTLARGGFVAAAWVAGPLAAGAGVALPPQATAKTVTRTSPKARFMSTSYRSRRGFQRDARPSTN